MITLTKYNQTIIRGDKNVTLKGLYPAAFGTERYVNSNLKACKIKAVKSLCKKSSCIKGEEDVKIQNFHSSSYGSQGFITAHHENRKVIKLKAVDNLKKTKLKGEKNVFKTTDTSERDHSFYAGSYFEIGYSQINTLGLSGYKLKVMKEGLESKRTCMPESRFIPICRDYLCGPLQRLSQQENVSKELACVSTLYCL